MFAEALKDQARKMEYEKMKKEEFKEFTSSDQPKEMGFKDVFKGIKLDVNLKEGMQILTQGASEKVNSILQMRKKLF